MIIENLQELYKQIIPGRPILALDWGMRKVGIALSTPDHSFSMPHSIIDSKDPNDLVAACSKCATEENACVIIIGLPLNMDGSRPKNYELIEQFATKIAQISDLPIYMQDERLTSKAADNLLINAGFNRKRRNQIDDKISANLILETVLTQLKLLGK